jgi:hypothetical protein
METTPEPWTVHEGRDPEKELRSLRSRFAAIRNRADRRARLLRFGRGMKAQLWIGGAVFCLAFFGLLWSPFSVRDTIRHVLAFPRCDAARAVGLAPARRGSPGYWAHLDRDQDGIACETWHD